MLDEQKGDTTLEQRGMLAAKAFEVCAHYDVAIAKYFMHWRGAVISWNPFLLQSLCVMARTLTRRRGSLEKWKSFLTRSTERSFHITTWWM